MVRVQSGAKVMTAAKPYSSMSRASFFKWLGPFYLQLGVAAKNRYATDPMSSVTISRILVDSIYKSRNNVCLENNSHGQHRGSMSSSTLAAEL